MMTARGRVDVLPNSYYEMKNRAGVIGQQGQI
jgi:hypothetical protein